jgi:hypothetical protein
MGAIGQAANTTTSAAASRENDLSNTAEFLFEVRKTRVLLPKAFIKFVYVASIMGYRIFISSTIEDLADERQAATEAIDALRQTPIRAEYFMPRRNNPVEVCTAEAAQSAVYVGIFKRRYGFVPTQNNRRGLSMTALEYEAALKAQIPIKIFVSSDSNSREPALTSFLDQVTDTSSGHWRKTFASVDELKFQITASVAIEIISYYDRANARALDVLDGLDNQLMSPEFETEYSDIGIRNFHSIAYRVIERKRGAEKALRGDLA